MTLRIDERIDERYALLTPQERRAADAVLSHLDDLATYSAAELADLAGVSKATMSRLFRHLDFDDFASVREHARALRNSGVPLAIEDGIEPAAHLEREVDNLRRALSALEVVLPRAVSLVTAAGRVYVVGMRNSYPVALHLRQQLAQVRHNVTLTPQPGQTMGEDLVSLTAHDVVLVVGFRRRVESFDAMMASLAASEASVILVSDASGRAYAHQVDVWIECPLESRGAFDSYAAGMSVVSVLADAVLKATDGATTRVRSISAAYERLAEIQTT
ncbi:MurR/RpiR family transcriptional regulator [soil metagenome]